MSANAELLNFINKNASMGRDSVDHIISLTADSAFRELLLEMHDGYSRVVISSEALLAAGGEAADGVSAMARMMSGAMIDFSTIGDRTSSRFASMLLEGVERGIKELEEKMRIYSGARHEYMNLAHAFRRMLLDDREALKAYL